MLRTTLPFIHGSPSTLPKINKSINKRTENAVATVANEPQKISAYINYSLHLHFWT